MVGWHHQLNGQKFEQTQGDSEGQGSLVPPQKALLPQFVFNKVPK